MYLARNADIFITECSLKNGQQKADWPHLNPETSATVAKKADARKLLLIHYDASIYLNRKDRDEAQKEARKIFRESYSTFGDMKISV